jgi:hypothetical protein
VTHVALGAKLRAVATATGPAASGPGPQPGRDPAAHGLTAPIIRGMPFAYQPAAEQVTSRDKLRIAGVCAAILLVIAAIAVWAAFRPGSYGSSKNGCITVSIPNTTGGALMHQCGTDARSTCKRAYAGTDKISALTRPQCRLAGLTQASSAAAG